MVSKEPTFSDAACNSPDDEDRALVLRYRGGDREAFTELVVRYQRSIYNAAFWISKRPEDANDAAQTTFLKAAEHIDDYDPQYKFFSWIYRIAVNEALNQVRRRGHEEALDDEGELLAPDSGDPARQFVVRQRKLRLDEALMKLSTNDRTVITLRHFAELSYAEIADILGVEERTVKSRLFEARHRLRPLIGDLQEKAT